MSTAHHPEDESLRQALIDLDRARVREQELRLESEAILEGLRILSEGGRPEELFRKIYDQFEPLIGFDRVLLLQPTKRGTWMPTLSSEGPPPEFEIEHGQLLQRVTQGEVVTCFDLTTTPQFNSLAGNDLGLGSGILGGLEFDGRPLVVLCAHPDRGHFTRADAQFAARFIPLLNQAMSTAVGQVAKGRVAALRTQAEVQRSQIQLLEQGTRVLGIGLMTWSGTDVPEQASGTLLEMTADWASTDQWWQAICKRVAPQELLSTLLAGQASLIELNNPAGRARAFELTLSQRGDAELSIAAPILVTDCTHSVIVERQRAAAEKRYRSLFDGSLDGIALFDLTGRMIECNSRATEMLNISGSLSGTSWLQFHCQQSQQDGYSALSDLAEYGASRYEADLLREDGSYFSAEIAASLVEVGEEALVQAVFRNITVRKDAEWQLRQSESRKGAIVSNALDCIISIDENGDIIEFNPAAEETLGWSRSEVLGRRLSEVFIPEALRGAHDEGFARFIRTGEARVLGQRLELPAVRKDGRPILTEAAITQTVGLDGRPVFTGFLRDITEQKAAQETLQAAKDEAEAASNAKSDFLASMSHELRTPLHVIAGVTELAREHAQDGELSELLEVVDSSSRALLGLIDDLLDISRIEAGQLTIETRDVDLIGLLTDLQRMFQFRASEKNLTLKWEIDASLPPRVHTDPARLRQILVNLLNNAVKYTDQGSVTLRASYKAMQSEPSLCMSVHDTGHGFDEAQRDSMFERFNQLGKTGDMQPSGGLGLGLAITQGLVELMGGKIDVSSQVGVGSQFSVRIPAAPSNATTAQHNVARELVANIEHRSLRVLVVDDNPDNRMLADRLLSKAGHQVQLAEDGRQCVDLLRADQPDIILMDVEMPGWNGFETIKRLRLLEGCSKIPVIALTAHAIQGFRERCFAAGMDDYLSKPFSKAELLEIVQRHAHSQTNPLKRIEQAHGAPVEIDEDVIDLVPGYLKRTRELCCAVCEYADAHDHNEIRAVAHKIKGSGSSYGFPEITSMGTGIHAAAVGEEHALAAELAQQLIRYIDEVRYQARNASSK